MGGNLGDAWDPQKEVHLGLVGRQVLEQLGLHFFDQGILSVQSPKAYAEQVLGDLRQGGLQGCGNGRQLALQR
jgi:hypothetical protein